MKKTLILFTGSSTAGKTTFVQLLSSIDENLHPMVQATSREPRSDDDLRFMRHYSPEEYEKQSFWIRSKQYGIINDDIKNFLLTNQNLAIGIVGVRDLMQAVDNASKDFDVRVVLVRFSSLPLWEEPLSEYNIRQFFTQPEVRIEQNKRHIHEFFINDEFIKNYVDLILPRDMPLIERVHLFGKTFNHKASQTTSEEQLLHHFNLLNNRSRI